MKKNKLYNSINTSICILIILIFSIVFISKVCLSDMFFDLKTGESILKNGIDFLDHFSFIKGLTYIYHHYLYDLIIYFINKIFGIPGIFIFFYIVVCTLGIVIYKINMKICKNKFISLLISLLTIYYLRFALTNRIQTITYLLFYIQFYLLNKLYNDGNKKYSILIILNSILIVNLHMPIWILNIIFFLPFIFEDLINVLKNKYKFLSKLITNNISFNSPNNKKLFYITFIVTLLSGLISPLKAYPYIFFIKALNNPGYSAITEMAPTAIIKDIHFLLLALLIFIIITIIKSKIQFKDFAFIAGLFLFSLIANRNKAFFFLIIPTIIVKILVANYNSKIPSKLKKFKNKFDLKIISLFTICILLFIYSFLLINLDIKHFDYKINRDYPIKSVNYIKKNLDYKNIRLYNNFDYGSFFEYYDIPVFIDSRAEVFIKEFNGGKDIMYDYNNVSKYGFYKLIFNKYKFNYALVINNTSLYHYLDNDIDFEIIFNEDNYYILFKYIK